MWALWNGLSSITYKDSEGFQKRKEREGHRQRSVGDQMKQFINSNVKDFDIYLP